MLLIQKSRRDSSRRMRRIAAGNGSFCASGLVIAVLAIIIGFFVDKSADEQQKTKLALNYLAIQTGILSILNDHPIPSLKP